MIDMENILNGIRLKFDSPNWVFDPEVGIVRRASRAIGIIDIE